MARILVVDDQMSVLLMIESILLKKGHAVTCVDNPIDAMDKLSNFPFDLLISDIMMPGGITGLNLTKSIRSDKKLSKIPIMLLTGRREPKDIKLGIEAGADDYIVKPLDPDVFILKVESLLQKKSATGETQFSHCGVAAEAEWDLKIQITNISEIGMTLMSPLPTPDGIKLKIKSSFFAAIGINSPQLRVISCEPILDGSGFTIKVHFIGMTENSLQPLRLWIRNQLIKAA